MNVDVPPLDDIHDQSGNNILDENFFDEDNHLEEVRTGMRAGSKSRPRETERLQIRHEKRDTKRLKNEPVFTDDAGTMKLIFKVSESRSTSGITKHNFSQKQHG